MYIFYNSATNVPDELKIEQPLFKFVEEKNPNLGKYDIFLKFIENGNFEIIYQKNKTVECNSQNVKQILEIIIELQTSHFQTKLNEKKHFSEINDKIDLYKENLVLHKKLIYDHKFDCFNYGYFKLQCNNEIGRFKRYAEPFSVLLLDIDNFKSINDEYGHDVGDIVLEKFIDAIKKNIRTVDMVFRFGGDEFVVLLHKAMMVGSLIVSKRIQSSINNISFNSEDLLLENKVRTSIGIVTVSEEIDDNALDIDEIFKRADLALYKAKNTGKNKIIHFENYKKC